MGPRPGHGGRRRWRDDAGPGHLDQCPGQVDAAGQGVDRLDEPRVMSMNRGPSGPMITSADSAPCQPATRPAGQCSRASGRSRPSLWLAPPSAPSRNRWHAWNATSSPRANTAWTMASGPARLLNEHAFRPERPEPLVVRGNLPQLVRPARRTPADAVPIGIFTNSGHPACPGPGRLDLGRGGRHHRGRLRHPGPGQRPERRHLVLDPGQRGEAGHRGGHPRGLDPVPGQRHDRKNANRRIYCKYSLTWSLQSRHTCYISRWEIRIIL